MKEKMAFWGEINVEAALKMFFNAEDQEKFRRIESFLTDELAYEDGLEIEE